MIENLFSGRPGEPGIGRLLSLSDISEEEIRSIGSEFFKRVRGRHDPYSVYLELLIERGVMCPHPSEKIERRGKTSFICMSCETYLGPGATVTEPLLSKSVQR